MKVTQARSSAAASTKGKTSAVTAVQPKRDKSVPEDREAITVKPKIRKSLKACTLLRSCGPWQSVTRLVAPMKPKFHPTPSAGSECALEIFLAPSAHPVPATQARVRLPPVLSGSPRPNVVTHHDAVAGTRP